MKRKANRTPLHQQQQQRPQQKEKEEKQGKGDEHLPKTVILSAQNYRNLLIGLINQMRKGTVLKKHFAVRHRLIILSLPLIRELTGTLHQAAIQILGIRIIVEQTHSRPIPFTHQQLGIAQPLKKRFRLQLDRKSTRLNSSHVRI